MSTAATILAIGAEASAARILSTSVSPMGELQVLFEDREHRNETQTYTLAATVSAFFVCATDGVIQPSPELQDVIVSNRRKPFERILLDGAGRPGAPLTLSIAMEEVELDCPAGYDPRIAEIRYSRIRLFSNGGPAALGRDAFRTLRITH
ncbi:hypothetical protein [Polyangium fumosum]|uniref:Uncharacterized protein n=1 Tax=Polyangium fumosum TaxID=889272 RepID=A0A4U1IIE5_9BACT|nr:hypothetical protein [Polyangium fumosum]TKC93656.1 hypothetical protein E8A74_49285 [Polyangium fumosum]